MQDRTVAFYPGPAGATESELPLGAWDRIVDANPGSARCAPDVEALIVRMPDRSRTRARLLTWCRSTRCYELVGRLRTPWRGFDGGQEARAALDEFFADRRRAQRGRRPAARRDARADVHRRRHRARAVRRAPNLPARLRIEETTGEPVHALALRCQVRIEPQRRRYDDAEERALLDLFGDRTRLAADPQAVPVDARARPSRRGSPGAPRSTCRCRAPTTSTSRAPRYLHALRDGEVPLLFLFSGTVFSRGTHRLRRHPGAVGPARPGTGCRSRVWRDLMEAHFPGTEWLRMRPRHRGGARPLPARPRPHHLGRRRRPTLLAQASVGGAVMTLDLARLAADAVLYEGYLLYPYRSTAAKNQVRWQFGVLGPPGAAEAGWGRRPAWPSSACCGRTTAPRRVHRAPALPAAAAAARPSGATATAASSRSPSCGPATRVWTSWDEAVEVERELGTFARRRAASAACG